LRGGISMAEKSYEELLKERVLEAIERLHPMYDRSEIVVKTCNICGKDEYHYQLEYDYGRCMECSHEENFENLQKRYMEKKKVFEKLFEEDWSKRTAEELHAKNLKKNKTFKRQEIELKNNIAFIEKLIDQTVNTLANIIERKDPYTAGHHRNVADLACKIAENMNLSPKRIKGIYVASILHDIGKIAVPNEILSKPITLSTIEGMIVRTHCQVGYEILKEINFPWKIADIVYQHHERINGSGYPKGLCDEEIMLEAKILAVADVVDAISSNRPYRPALGLDYALTEITKNRGILYAPEVVDACLEIYIVNPQNQSFQGSGIFSNNIICEENEC